MVRRKEVKLMEMRNIWIALSVLVLLVLVLPILGAFIPAWAGVPTVQAAGGWGWGSHWCGY